MKKCLMAASLLVVAVIGFASASPSPVGREMTSAEAWSKSGGFGIRCIATNPQCVNDYPSVFSTQGNSTACYPQIEMKDGGGNKTFCKDKMTLYDSCTSSGADNSCLLYKQCRWDFDTSKCVVSLGGWNRYAYTVGAVSGSICPREALNPSQ
jgi:hypothetical protein